MMMSSDTTSNKPYFMLLIQFLIESELHDHPTYLIDSMWGIHVMLKDWKCMTDLLLSSSNELDDINERYLIEIMTCAVKQASTGEAPVGRATTGGGGSYAHATTTSASTVVPTKQQSKQINDDRVQLTLHFLQTITQLLTKNNSDDENLLNLLQIPLYFDLNQYKERRYEKYIDSLLDELMDIYLKKNQYKRFKCM